MAGGTEFNSGKFKELVLLLAARSKNDPQMSRVKLNKLLYRSDFEAFRLLGRSITGATYIRGEHGPMAKQLPLAEKELGRNGLLSWKTEAAGPYERKIPTTEQGVDEKQFTTGEIAIVDATVAELAGLGGRGAREWSHETAVGWRVREDGDEIPYSSALLSLRELDDVALEALEQRLSA